VQPDCGIGEPPESTLILPVPALRVITGVPAPVAVTPSTP
jgi:hypothetical protein